MAYLVSQGAREIGIRIAMGATSDRVLYLVLRQGMQLTLLGVIIGLAGAFLLRRVMRDLLYGITPTDPITFLAIPAILAAVAFLACYVPARRAAAVNPMSSLRCE